MDENQTGEQINIETIEPQDYISEIFKLKKQIEALALENQTLIKDNNALTENLAKSVSFDEIYARDAKIERAHAILQDMPSKVKRALEGALRGELGVELYDRYISEVECNLKNANKALRKKLKHGKKGRFFEPLNDLIRARLVPKEDIPWEIEKRIEKVIIKTLFQRGKDKNFKREEWRPYGHPRFAQDTRGKIKMQRGRNVVNYDGILSFNITGEEILNQFEDDYRNGVIFEFQLYDSPKAYDKAYIDHDPYAGEGSGAILSEKEDLRHNLVTIGAEWFNDIDSVFSDYKIVHATIHIVKREYDRRFIEASNILKNLKLGKNEPIPREIANIFDGYNKEFVEEIKSEYAKISKVHTSLREKLASGERIVFKPRQIIKKPLPSSLRGGAADAKVQSIK
jgi:hypothetical protein